MFLTLVFLSGLILQFLFPLNDLHVTSVTVVDIVVSVCVPSTSFIYFYSLNDDDYMFFLFL